MGDGTDFEWKWRDPTHLEAHRHEFLRPVEDVLNDLRSRAAECRGEEGTPLHEEWELPYETGLGGLKEVSPDGSESFWAPRPGRTILSHLCRGERLPTRWICLWGKWEDEAFIIHTLYPGRKAPREIHDPEITPEELPAAIEFWRTHAIVVE